MLVAAPDRAHPPEEGLRNETYRLGDRDGLHRRAARTLRNCIHQRAHDREDGKRPRCPRGYLPLPVLPTFMNGIGAPA